MFEYLDILDKDGNYKGYQKPRMADLDNDEFSRVIHVWIKNSNGMYLVQKRSKYKKVDPNLWSITAGHVSGGEDSIVSLRRELMEELSYNLDESKLKYIFTLFPKEGIHHIADIYVLYDDIDIDQVMAQYEEVQAVRYVTKEQILDGIKDGTFNNFNNMYDNYYDKIFEVI